LERKIRNDLAKALVGVFYSIQPINGAAIDSRWGWGLVFNENGGFRMNERVTNKVLRAQSDTKLS